MPSDDLTRPLIPTGGAFGQTLTSDGSSTGPDPAGPPPAADEPRMPTIPGYELLSLLGRGGMGLVFKARQISLNRLAAVKTVRGAEVADPTTLMRFWAEAQAVADLHHPHVVQVYELGQHDRTPYLAMEYLPGGSLAERIAQHKLASPDVVAALVEKIARGVNAAHEHGVVHRDLKPANVLFDEAGEPRVTDFGLAKRTAGADLTRTQAVMGTPSYMAPEQAGGRAKFVGPPADVWALGVILYECLTGKRPFEGECTADVLNAVQNTEPKSVRSITRLIPKDLETICRKAMQKEPAHRYQTAGEFADDLGRYLAGEAIKARPLTLLQRGARWGRRHPSAAALIGVCLFAGTVIGVGGWVSAARLRSALDEAKANALEASRQRTAVDAGMKARFATIEELMMYLDGRLKNAPYGEAVRKDFTTQLTQYGEQILAERPDDPEVVRGVARLFQRHGEACEAASDPAAGEQAYAKAADLYRRLLTLTPGDADVPKELAASLYGRAQGLESVARWADARRVFGEAAEAYRAAGGPRAAVSVARCRYHEANNLAVVGKLADAIPLYTAALAEQQAFAAANPTDDDALEDVGLTATALGLAAAPTDPAGAAHLRTALDAFRKARSAAPTVSRYDRQVYQAYIDLGDALERQGRDADLLALAAEYVAGDPASADDWYNAACISANAARTTKDKAAADAYGKAAVEYLRRSVARGWTDRAHLIVDVDMDPLRERGDYQAVVAGLDRKAGTPVRPADILKAIKGVYRSVSGDQARADSPTASFVDKRRAARPRPGTGFDRFAGLAVKLADDHPDTPAAVNALTWVVETAAGLKGDAAKAADPAVARLGKYVGRPEFQSVCRTLAGRTAEQTDRLLAEAAAKQPDDKGRGLASYYLGYSLTKQAEAAPVGSKEQLALFARAEAAYEQVAKEYAAVTVNDANLGEAAARKLYAVRHLSVGRTAREVSGPDVDGKPFKLSDYRGKVVLLDFWANWCGFCREMYPAEREMVTKYNGRPFALIGVNCDGDKTTVRRVVQRERINWRSWVDGSNGPISSGWQVDSYPQMVLIDHNGVIRQRWEGKTDAAAIEAAVEKLLAEVER
jgi:thiol-disulfide isomerase/thioredoxin/tRNA A-37 threonylcarbamoyl transferase component Bud32